MIQDPPSRNQFCGVVTKPDHVLNGTAQYPACAGAFANDFSGGYSFMSVLTHTEGRAVVQPLPQNVCGFNSETWQGRSTPWDQPIDWPTSNISAGPRTFTWNISWGSHYSDTKEFRYWITKPGFQYQVGKPLTWSDFEDNAFCVLSYDDATPNANPNVVPDKAQALFHTKCNIPQRSGRHVIYGEWGRNHFTYERFHSCVDVVFGGSTSSGFSLSSATGSVSLAAGETRSIPLTISRTGGFSGAVALTAGGLPAGLSATFSPASVTGSTATLTLKAANAVPAAHATLLITGTSGAVVSSFPVSVELKAQPDFSIATPSATISLARGKTATQAITISRLSGFSASVSFSASGLPSGVTASFAPAAAAGNSTTLTLQASSTAFIGPATIVVTGTSAALSRTANVAISITPPENESFSLSLNSPPVSLTRGGSGAATLGISRTGGFGAALVFSATQLPAGITATFNPPSAAGATTATQLTLSASQAAIAGSGTVLVSAIGGGVTKTLSVPFTVSGGNPGSGAVTIVSKANVNQPWYTELAVQLANTLPITSLRVRITIQRTPGINYAGQYNTIGGTIQQANSASQGQVAFDYVLAPNQALSPGTHRIFAAQASGNGTAHPTAGDTWEVTYSSGGPAVTQTGKF